ncbi:aspartyl protease family A01B, putative [Phytophthora infestans T30-4]|uniref:Aspartyl protease family A01B, putative n=1 Tax=Phytophthora infestans (strain T30-4) TaxID=403677 RepID=D0MWT5_PHYIT|nr:aspartyl protease family A01B, putative [Phytophthora infestans T30-4]EEY64098.1 aspartyl protease family A01B, putative [Phytophthora infestans T30-4]|eukprot:XP_002907534.1 aspartyl protease family A01B, putative [Phytophthora infestans T30-4]
MVDELVWVGGFSTPSDEMEGILKTFGFRFPVGCQTKETGLFITQKENGIMGLGRHRSTVMSYMLNAGRVTQNLFTLCFAGDGGELVFGGVDYSHHTSDVGYTPLLDDKSAYYPVHVKDIRMNGVSLGIDAGTINSGRGVIVDSGTTDTFFDSKGSRAFMKAFQNAAGREYSEKRMDLTADELAALPTISIILSGMKGDGTEDIQLDIPASSYLTPSDKVGSYNGNFHFSERSGGVLGASTMIGFDVIFDTENKRVGFAESDCGVALGVMVWTKWRTRSWSRIPNATETSRAHMETVVDMNDNRSLSPTSPPGSPLSPRSRAARKGQSPKFTIGSPVDEEDADKFREEEEG